MVIIMAMHAIVTTTEWGMCVLSDCVTEVAVCEQYYSTYSRVQ